MIILVTGGTGFIGSHLCEQLVLQNHHVICVDNNFTGNMSNIAHLKKYDNFEFIRHDITKEILVECDQIYHLACPASPKNYQYNSIKTLKTNVLGTMNMLGLAKRVKAKFLLASTSEIYGDPLSTPQKEEDWGNVNPIGIRACYDEGKRVAETLTFQYHRDCHVDVCVARIFNTYGPRLHENDGRVISNFIYQALQGKDLTVLGDGSQTRSFCFVTDTVNGLIKLMNASHVTGPVNIGNPCEMTILQVAEYIKKITKSKSSITFHQLPSDDPRRRCPDIQLAKKVLGWSPIVDFEEGIRHVLEYIKSGKT